jgi:hypothetical protein
MRSAMSDLFDDVEKLADSHPKQTDEALTKLGDEADTRTGNKYDKEINAGVSEAEKHFGDGHSSN